MPNGAARADEYGNLHYLSDKLASGGQGTVFRTKDADLAIKQPINKATDLQKLFQNIRILPLPPHIPISMPLAILRDEPGYVMRLLNDMKPVSFFDYSKEKEKLSKRERPQWLKAVPDEDMALRLLHYTQTGSTRRRLLVLSKCASILARLHGTGLIYGDISPDNVFAVNEENPEVWLIDADNLRFEQVKDGKSVFTPQYGAPEIVQGTDQSRPRTDCWAFAVLAFRVIALCHPFIGKKVLENDNSEDCWDAESAANNVSVDPDEQAYAGLFPFIDDTDDKSNFIPNLGLSRALVATSGMRRLFQETFGVGRTKPHRRPAMAFWALELAKAFDHSLICNNCEMSFFADEHEKCPYCDTGRPAYICARTQDWELYIPADKKEFPLPHRLFNPFSFEHNDDTEYEAVIDFAKKSVVPVRGTNPFPENLSFDFVEAKK